MVYCKEVEKWEKFFKTHGIEYFGDYFMEYDALKIALEAELLKSSATFHLHLDDTSLCQAASVSGAGFAPRVTGIMSQVVECIA